ncbi:MAG: Mov34/MPN/PAD-1 family protein [Chloroflexota bacterium]|nr:MAG: hypothetical protein DLM70_09380 [Chloroflexota bacterium]
MVISRQHVHEMIEHARAGFPNEACGLVASTEDRAVKVYCIENSDPSPVFYHMDPQEQLRAIMEIDDAGWDLGAIFHSHTRTSAYPSQTDVGLAHYPDALYIIVSLAAEPDPEIKAFRIKDGGIREAFLEVVE